MTYDSDRDLRWINLGTYKPYPGSDRTYNLYKVSAVLSRTGRDGRRLAVTIDWATSRETFAITVTPISDMTFENGAQVEIILCTETAPGHTNGFPHVEAVEVYTGIWAPNTL